MTGCAQRSQGAEGHLTEEACASFRSQRAAACREEWEPAALAQVARGPQDALQLKSAGAGRIPYFHGSDETGGGLGGLPEDDGAAGQAEADKAGPSPEGMDPRSDLFPSPASTADQCAGGAPQP